MPCTLDTKKAWSHRLPHHLLGPPRQLPGCKQRLIPDAPGAVSVAVAVAVSGCIVDAVAAPVVFAAVVLEDDDACSPADECQMQQVTIDEFFARLATGVPVSGPSFFVVVAVAPDGISDDQFSVGFVVSGSAPEAVAVDGQAADGEPEVGDEASGDAVAL